MQTLGGRVQTIGSLLFAACVVACGGASHSDAHPGVDATSGAGDGASPQDGAGDAGEDGAGGDATIGDGGKGEASVGDGGTSDAPTDGGGADGGDAATVVTGQWKIVGGRYFDVPSAWMAASNDLWAIGGSGATLHFDGKWLAVTAVDAIDKKKVFGLAPDDVWILGLIQTTGDSVAMHFDGSAWTTTTIAPMGPAPGFYATDLWASSATNAWAVGLTGSSDHAFHFDGTSWSEVTIPPGAGVTPHLWGVAGDPDVWLIEGLGTTAAPTGFFFHAGAWTGFNVAGGPDYTNYKWMFGRSPTDAWMTSGVGISHFDGTSWTTSLQVDGGNQPFAGPGLALAANDVWVPGNAYLLHFDGTRWTGAAYPMPTANSQLSLAGVAANEVRAFSPYTRSRWDGVAWKVTWDDLSGTLTSFACVSDSDCFGAGGYIQRWDGEGWTTSFAGSLDYLGVFATSANDAWAVGADHAHFDGTQWTTVPAIGSDTLRAVWGSSPSDYWAVGGTALEHFDGTGWTNLPAVVVTVGTTTGNALLEAVWGAASNDVYAVGSLSTTGAPVILHFDGTVWKAVQGVPAAGALQAIFGLAADDVYVAGDASTLLHFDGTKWSSIATGDPGAFQSVWASSTADVWVGSFVAGDSRLLHFDGSTWTRVAVPWADPSVVQAFGGRQGAIWASDSAGDLLRFD
jgi:hypothetical protein